MPIAPLLRCTDLDATRRHYRDVLQFTVTDTTQSTLTVQLCRSGERRGGKACED